MQCSLLLSESCARQQCRPAFGTVTQRRWSHQGHQQRPPRSVHAVRASSEPNKSKPEFGYTRKDAIIIGVGLIGGGYAIKAGLEAAGVDDIQSGVFAQLAVFLFLCFGWVGSYIFRVATKQMTYVQQLQQYEEAVMQKRLEEMTEEEVKALAEELEREKQGRQS